jgi:hypothetical protein
MVADAEEMANWARRTGPTSSGLAASLSSSALNTFFNDSDRPRRAGPHPTDAEVRAAYDHMVGYCARYQVEDTRRVIVFHIDVAQSANGGGTTRERRFELRGDELTLYPTPTPSGVTEWSIHARRVKP